MSYSLYHSPPAGDKRWTETDLRRHWRQVVGILAKRGAGFVLIDRNGGGKGSGLRKGWNEPGAGATKAQALAHLDRDGNVGIQAGTGAPLRLYAFDLDANAERGHESPHLAGTLYIYRPDAPDRGKFIFACADDLPRRAHGETKTELLGWTANGKHWNCVVAGVHKRGAPILWGGHQIVTLLGETVKAMWRDWTGEDLIPERSQRPPHAPDGLTPELALIEDALRHIDPNDIDYQTWISVLAALHETFGNDALDVADAWADGKPGEVEAKFASFGHYTGAKAGVGTIFHLAQANGWEMSSRVSRMTPDEFVGFHEEVLRYKAWLHMANATEWCKVRNVQPNTGIKLMDAILDLCAEWGSFTIRPGLRLLALRAGMGVAAVGRNLPKLTDFATVTQPPDDAKFTAATITLVRASSTITVERQRDHSGTTIGTTVIPLTFYSDHRCDDAFRNDHPAYQRRNPDALRPLGETALRVVTCLLDGPQTPREITDHTGVGIRTAQRVLQRAHDYGLATAQAERHNVHRYTLVEAFREDLEVLRRNMTTYGVQMRREIQYAESRLQTARASGDAKRIERAKQAYNRTTKAITGWHGDNPAQWVGVRRGWRWVTRWDRAEEERGMADVRAEVRRLKAEGVSRCEIRRMLAYGNHDAVAVSQALALV